jgi:hypothetical protein
VSISFSGILAFSAWILVLSQACNGDNEASEPPAPEGTEASAEGEPPDGEKAAIPDCADQPSDLPSRILAAVEAGDVAAIYYCLSEQTRGAFGPLAQFKPLEDFHPLALSLMGFPVDSELILNELVGSSDLAVVAIRGDRLVEFANVETGDPVSFTEENAVFAGLAVLEEGSWRLDAANQFFITNQAPAYTSAPGGNVTLEFDAVGGDRPGDVQQVLIWVDQQVYTACIPGDRGPCITVARSGAGQPFHFSLPIDVGGGFHEVVIFIEQGGSYGVGAWWFEAAAEDSEQSQG